MKKTILLFLSLASFAFSAPIDTEKVQQEVVKQIVKQGAESGSVEIVSAENAKKYVNLEAFKIADTCTLGSLTCPRGQPGYFTRSLSTKLETGDVYCAIYSMDNIDRPMFIYTYNNKSCKKTYEENLDAVAPQSKAAAKNLSAKASSILERQKTIQTTMDAQNKLGDNFIDLTEFILAVATQDNEIIDLVATAENGEIRMNPSVTTSSPFKNQQEPSASENIITKKAAAMFVFAPHLQEVLDSVLFLLLSVSVVAGTIFHGLPLLKKSFDSQQNSDFASTAGQWALVVAGALIFFAFPATEVKNNDVRIIQTKFQSVFTTAIKEASIYSQQLNIHAQNAVFRSILKERGFTQEGAFLNAFASKSKNEKLQVQYEDGVNYCNQYFDPDKIRAYVGSGEYLYPISEQELHKKWVQNNPNVATSPNFDLLRKTTDVANSVVAGRLPPTISQCGEWERALKHSKTAIQYANKTIDEGINSQASVEKAEALSAIMERQYKAIYEYGWMSAIFLPTVVYTMEMHDGVDSKRRDEIRDAMAKEGDIGEGVIPAILESIPMLAVPGVSTLVSLFSSTGSLLGELVAGNFAIKAFAGDIGKSMGGLVGSLFGVYAVSTTLKSLAFIVLTATSLVVFMLLYVEIFFYFFVSPFALVIAIGTNQVDMLKKFMSKIFNFIIKILIFPVSIFLAIESHFLLQDIGNYIIPGVSAISLETLNDLQAADGFWAKILVYVDKMKIYVFIGALKLFIMIAALILSFKLIPSAPGWIADYLGLEADRVHTTIDEIKAGAGQYGSRI